MEEPPLNASVALGAGICYFFYQTSGTTRLLTSQQTRIPYLAINLIGYFLI